jgi:hypothetical protein
LYRYDEGISRMKHPLFITTRVGLYILLAGGAVQLESS